MKKALIGLLLVTLCFSASGKTLDHIISEFSKATHAEKLSIGSSACSLIKITTSGNKEPFSTKINSLFILDLEDCSEEVKSNFSKQIDKLNMNGYEILMKIKDDTDQILILSKSRKDVVEEFVLVSLNDPAIIRIKGNFNLTDLPAVKKQYIKKKNNL